MKVQRYIWIVAILIMASSPALAKDPKKMPNNSWISLSGTVAAASVSDFELDYGQGLIMVEMDDWDWYKETYLILPGDRVTVYGYVDDDFLENTSIEASSVYVANLNTFFYADNDDEEDVLETTMSESFVDNGLQLRGKITSVDGRRFTVDTAKREIKIDTIEMFYNPLDDKGYQKIKVGDYVQVTGALNSDVFKKSVIMANSITTLIKDKTKKRND